MSLQRLGAMGAICGVVIAAAAGCGSGAATGAKAAQSSTHAPSQALRTVTLRLDWIPSGYNAGFVYGATHGIYKKYGINLQWTWGNGSTAAVKYADTGKVMFADGNANAVLAVDAAGGNVKMIYGFMQENPDSILIPVKLPIHTLSQLQGKTVAGSPGSSTSLLFPAVLHAAKIPLSAIHLDNMSASAKTLALFDGKVDAELDYGFETQPELAAKGLNTRLINYASYGVNPINLGIVANTTMLTQHPGLTKAFVAATQASILAAMQHPNAAAEAVFAHSNGTSHSEKILLAQWKASEKFFQTPNDAGHAMGWMSQKDWQDTETLGQKYLGLKTSVSLNQVYTNQFVPAASASSQG